MGRSLIEKWIDNASKKYKLNRESKKLIKEIMKYNVEKVVQQIEVKAVDKNYKNHFIGPKLTHEICEENLSIPKRFTKTAKKDIIQNNPEVV